jgi:uncharacterized membrane protein
MTELKTIAAELEPMLRPRRMGRIHTAVARIRAEGAWFDALLWSVFALVIVGALICVLNFADIPFLARRGIDERYVVAGGVLLAVFVAATLWWRWFKWRVHAIERPDAPDGQLP